MLTSSADPRHRAIAAQMMGYGRQSDQQIDALVRASLDADDVGRIAGIDETTLTQLIAAGQTAAILRGFDRRNQRESE